MGVQLWKHVLNHTGEIVSIQERFGGSIIAHDLSSILVAAALQNPRAAVAGNVTDEMRAYLLNWMQPSG